MPPKFQKLVSRHQALLTDEMIVSAWNDGERMKTCTGVDERVRNFEIINGDCYFDMHWMDQVVEKALAWPKQTSLQFIEQGVIHGERLRTFARTLTHISIEESRIAFWHSLDFVKNLLVFLPLTHPLAKAAEQQVRSILVKKGLSDVEQDNVLLHISRSKKANGPMLEEEALQKIKRRATQNPDFNVDRALKDHAKEFSYLGYREPFSEGYSLEFFHERYNDLKDSQPANDRFDLALTPDEQSAIELLQDFVFFRNYRTEKLYEALYFLEPLWKYLAKHHGLGETDLGWYREQECRELFEQHHKVDETILNIRKAGHGFTLHNDVIQLIVGDELQKKKPSLARPQEKIARLKGMSACRGRIQGPVKVLRSAKDQDKVETGDVLVASMTTPDYLPAMKRAAAFVTDEGGITCHAAIVSRELGKPCVIGTKHATSLLQDNQIVTVDGDMGFVEINKK